jgi:tellurium resistance protein TerZ
MAVTWDVFPLGNDALLAVRLVWASSAVDIDLQAVIVDDKGTIIDAAYYNNMKACGKAVTHSGDQGGNQGECREVVNLKLSMMPSKVKMILILGCCFTGGALRDCKGAKIEFEQSQPSKRPVPECMLSSTSSGLLVSILARTESAWELRFIMEELPGRHFMDCLDQLNIHIVKEIPTANRRQKVAFAMEKGETLDFGSSLHDVVMGLGWDAQLQERTCSTPGCQRGPVRGYDTCCRTCQMSSGTNHGPTCNSSQVDLDASAILMGNNRQVLECVFFGNLKTSGDHSRPGAVEHTGDNQTGEGDGDDESLIVRLDQLGPEVHDIFFCIHIYAKDQHGRPLTFSKIRNPYCRVLEAGAGGQELCRYTLSEAGERSGLVLGRLRRSPDGRWSFNALGIPCNGTMYKDSIPDLQRISQVDPRQLQTMSTAALLRSPTQELTAVAAAPHGPGATPHLSPIEERPPLAAVPLATPPPQPTSCCLLQ